MKKIIIVIAIIVIGGIGWYYTQHIAANSKQPLRFHGNVENRTQTLAFRFLGTIESIDKDEGDTVSKGDILVTLDTRALQYRLATLQAQIDAETAILQKLKKGYQPEEIDQARAALAESKAALVGIEDTYIRQKKLYEAKATATKNYTLATAKYDQAKAAYAKAQSYYLLLKKGYRHEDIQAQEDKINGLKAQVKGVLYDIEMSTLRAPTNGVILKLYKEPGSIVTAGADVFELALSDQYWVRAYVDEPSLGAIKRGEKMWIETDARKKPYSGHIGFISPVAEFTPKNIETTALRPDLVYRFRVIVDDPDAKLKQGMPVTISAQSDR